MTEQNGRARPPLSSLNGAPLTLDTSTAKQAIHFEPSTTTQCEELERLKKVIKTKDACLYNFSKTLRNADEKARQAEKELHAERAQYQTLQVSHEQLVRSSVTKHEALQAEVRMLAIQLAETHSPGDAKLHEDMSVLHSAYTPLPSLCAHATLIAVSALCEIGYLCQDVQVNMESGSAERLGSCAARTCSSAG
jgi:hypothetical protein